MARIHMREAPAGSVQDDDGCVLVLPPQVMVHLSLVAAHDGYTAEDWVAKSVAMRAEQIGLQDLAADGGLPPDGEMS